MVKTSQVLPQPYFTIQVPGGQSTTYRKTAAFRHAIRRDIQPESKITVHYGNGIWNSGTFDDYKTANQFLKECIEPELLEFIGGGKW